MGSSSHLPSLLSLLTSSTRRRSDPSRSGTGFSGTISSLSLSGDPQVADFRRFALFSFFTRYGRISHWNPNIFPDMLFEIGRRMDMSRLDCRWQISQYLDYNLADTRESARICTRPRRFGQICPGGSENTTLDMWEQVGVLCGLRGRAAEQKRFNRNEAIDVK
jgi:hypothetical protein